MPRKKRNKLQQLLSSWRRNRRRKRLSRKMFARGLRMEPLEDRRLLAFDVAIAAGSALTGIAKSGTATVTYTATADNASLGVDDLVGELNAGRAVVVNTGSSGTQDGDITVSVAVTQTSGAGGGLTLNAADVVTISQAITTLNGPVTISGSDVEVNNTINAGSGTVSFTHVGSGQPLTIGDSIAAGTNAKLNGALVSGGGVFNFTGAGRISPDNTKVAYLADEETDGVTELFVRAIDGSGSSLKLATQNNGSNFWQTYGFSSDSSRVIYTNDNKLFSVPATGGASVQLSDSASEPVGRFFPIISTATHTFFLKSDESAIYTVPIDGSSAPVQISEAGVTSIQDTFHLTPDGTRIVYLGNDPNNAALGDGLYSVPVGGGTSTKLNDVGSTVGHERTVVVTPDSSTVVFMANDVNDSDILKLWKSPITGGTNTLLSGTVSGLSRLMSHPLSATRVIFPATNGASEIELYSALLDASAAPIRISGTATASASILNSSRVLAVSPDGTKAGFITEAHLYVVPIDGSSAPTQLTVASHQLSFAPSSPLVFTPDSQSLIIDVDDRIEDADDVFLYPADGSTATRLSGDFVSGGAAARFSLAPDGSFVTYTADQDTDGVLELYSTSIGSGGFRITDAELDRVTTSDKIVVGDTNDGNVTFREAVSMANASSLDVVSNSDILETVSGNALSGDSLQVFGDLAPGAASFGTFDVDGNVTFDSTASFEVLLQNNTTAGTTYDQLSVTGSSRVVTLGNATLNLSVNGSFSASPGDEFVIINNADSGSSIAGGTTFNGLAEGATVSAGGNNFTISYMGGTNNNDVVLTSVAALDFGDAPSSYGTTLASGGARHAATGLTLGATRDSESDGVPTAGATGDDAATDDEDGVTFQSARVGQQNATVTVNVQGASGRLDAWIDFNNDGSFHDATERIARNLAVTTGDNAVTYDVPSDAKSGTALISRFRVSSAGNLGTTGLATDGEVEDHTITLQAPTTSGATFTDNGQLAVAGNIRKLALGDLDGDGDLDVVVGILGAANRVLTNNGNGTFTDSGQTLGSSQTEGIALGDVDGDGDLDMFVANNVSQANRVYLNNGSGTFTDSGQTLGANSSRQVRLGDLDGDGDLDAFVANTSENSANAANRVWLNNGSGTFTITANSLSNADSIDVRLGDLDGDGDLDAMTSNATLPSGVQENLVWINNGSATFTDSGQLLGPGSGSLGSDVSLADIDGDNDLDAWVGNLNQPNRVFTNNGSGTFALTAQLLGNPGFATLGSMLADLDGDGDLDAFAANNSQADRVYTNNGSGVFTDSGQTLGTDGSNDVELGDLDGDGDLDAVVTDNPGGIRVWLNQPPDNTAPTFTSIARQTPSTSPTNSDTLAFALTFSENVTNVTADDFTITGTTATGVLTGSGASYVLTLSSGNLANLNATVGLNLAGGQNITDIAGNALPAGEPATDETYVVDNTAPTFNSIARQTPATSPTNSDTLVLALTFSETVINVTADDFTVTGTTATAVLGGSGSSYTLSLSGGDLANLNATVGINLAGGQNITDAAGNALPAAEPATDETYVVDNTGVDFGDAPNSYGTTLASNGARHTATGLTLGASRDTETDGVPTNAANGDDSSGDDEDGVTFASARVGQQNATVTVNVQGASGRLDAWVDFNNDGSFHDKAERIARNLAVNTGDNTVTYDIPHDARSGVALLSRFRVSTAGNLTTTGLAADGEVEDHTVTLTSPGGPGVFMHTQTIAISPQPRRTSLADLDGDGDIDAFISRDAGAGGNIVLLNNGSGVFTDSGQTLGSAISRSSELADVDGDGDLDAYVAISGPLPATSGAPNELYLNNGSGTFTLGQSIGTNRASLQIAIGDLDGDGDFDAYIGNNGNLNNTGTGATVEDRVFLNNGSGTFTDSAQSITPNSRTAFVELGDLDRDGDLDAFLVNSRESTGESHRVRINNGSGVMSTGTALTNSARTTVVVAGDIDGDGDLDAVTFNYDNGGNQVWVNDGSGNFSTSQSLGSSASHGAAIGDVDGDGDFDIVVANAGGGTAQPNRVYLNNGSGTFTDSGQTLGSTVSRDVQLADLDGDGDLDQFELTGLDARVWLNQAPDNTAPTFTAIARQTPATSPTNSDTLAFALTFNENVTDVTADDFTIVGTTATGVLSGSGSSYVLTLSGGNLANLNGTVGLNLAGGQNITDIAGNALASGEPATDETYVVDNTAPTFTSIVRQVPATSPTNADTLVFRATFGEGVTNVNAADFTVTGTTATITNVATINASTYDLTVSGGNLASLNGTVTLNLSGSHDIDDLAGNNLPNDQPATNQDYVVDNTAPVVSSFARQTPSTTPTNADTLVFRATFNEDVTGVDAADFAVTGTTGTVTNVSTVSATTYDLTVSGGDLASFNGVVGLNLAGGQNITDIATNPLPGTEPATDETYTIDNNLDTTAPVFTSITRQTPATSPTNADTLVFRATFNEAVANVDAADFTVNGTSATITNVATVSTSVYDLTVSGGNLANLNATVDVDLAGGQNIADLAGNNLPGTEPATDESYVVSNSAPVFTAIARQTPATSPTNADALVFALTFSETVQNVTADDFTVTGTTATGALFGSGLSYTLLVSGGNLASLNGTVGVDLAGSQNITNTLGTALPAGEPATDQTYVVDNTAPSFTAIARQTPSTTPTNADTLVFGLTFSESVINVSADDFTITGTTGTGVLAGSGSSYTLTVSGGDLAALNGTVGLNLAGSQNITDAGGNSLPSGEPTTDQTYVVDNLAPSTTSISRQVPTSEDSNANTLTFRVVFSEPVNNVDPTDFSVTGSTATTGVAQINPTTFDVTVFGGDLPGVNGTVGLNINPGQNITDTAGNPLPNTEPATDQTFRLDNTAPGLVSFTRSNPTAERTNADALTFLATFNEAVTAVDAADFAVTGTSGTIAVTQVSTSMYNLVVSGGNLASLNAVVGINLAGGQNITDTAGNQLPNTEPSTDQTYTLDNTAPGTVSFTRKNPTSQTTNADTLTFLATFSDPVEAVDASDFAVTGTTGTISVSQVSTSTYDVLISGGDLATLNGTVGLNLAGGQNITDVAGNSLPNGEPTLDQTYTLDNDAPGLTSFTRSAPSTSPTNADNLVFRAAFDESVVGVDAADFALTGTTATITGVGTADGGAGRLWDISVAGGNLPTLNGTVGLNLSVSQNITDGGGNALPAGEPGTDETYLIDNTAPSFTSITRQNPTAATTNADSLVFRAVFSEDVTSVDAGDFSVSGTTATITNIATVNATTYDLTVTGGDLAGLNAVVGLDLRAGATITDLGGTALPAGEPLTDQTYNVENTAPTFTSITRQNPNTSPTNADILVFRATFSEAVANLDAADFAVTGTTATISNVAGISATTFDITVSGGDLAPLNATVGLNLAGSQNIADLAGNALPNAEPATDETFVVDNDAPGSTSFTRQNPATSTTSADSLVFRATFDEPMTAVDTADFVVNGTTTATVTAVASADGGAGRLWDVTVSGGNLASFNGTVGLNFAGGQNITDLAGNALPTGEPSTDETYVVDNDAPGLTSFTRQTPATSPTSADTLVFRATFDEAMANVDPGDFAVNGSTTATVAGVASADGGTGLLWNVTVSGGNLASFNGTVGLNLAGGQDITDLGGNALPSGEPATDESYLVDNQAPTTTSFTRLTPTDENTNADVLIFRASFNEDVTAVDTGDFAATGTSGTVTDVAQISASAYNVTVSGGDLATLNGVVGLNFAGGQNITDLAGNALPNGEPATDETYNVDNTAPGITSFTRKTPTTSPTSADTLTFLASFNQAVNGVDAADFVVNGATATISVSQVSASTFDVTLSGGTLANLNATVGIDLAGGQNIVDLAGNSLPSGEPTTDETYVVDNDLPAITSFARHTPATTPTSANTLVFRATFDEAVTAVDAADFLVTGTTASVAVTSVSPTTFDVTLSGGNLPALNGTVGLDLASSQNIVDLSGNAMPTIEPGTDETYVVDNTAPVLTSFTRQTPTASSTNADSLVFRATFGEPVTAVDAADFAVNGTTTATVSAVATADGGAGRLWNVTVSGGDLATFNGTVGLDLAGAQNISDVAGNALPSGEPATDETYLVDNDAPASTSFTRQNPATSPTNANTLVFRATFDEAMTGVDTGDFAVNGSTTATVMAVVSADSGAGLLWDVTVAGGDLATFNGTVGLNFAGGQNITDLAGNALPGGEPSTDETYVVDNDSPGATSFTRQTPSSSPTNADVLVFRATFDEAMAGVNTADFAVNGTTTATVTAVGSADGGAGLLWDVTVSGGDLPTFNGTVGIDLAAGQNITDLAGNALPSGEPTTDETYVVDNDAPVLTSFTRQTPTSSSTNADTLVFRASFGEAVMAVDAADFAVNGTTSATVTAVATADGGVGRLWNVTVSGGDLATFNGTVGLNLAGVQNVTDLGGNALPSGEPSTDETYLVDNDAPGSTSFTRQTPATSPTNANTLVFRATFDEAMTAIDTADFAVNGTTTATVMTVTTADSGAGLLWDVTVSGGDLATFNGTVGIDLAGGQNITDLAGNALPSGEPGTDETYLVDNDAPASTSFTRQTPSSSPTNADVLVFRATFDEAMTGVNAADFSVNGTTTATITAVGSADGGAGLLWDITVSGGDLASFNGTVGIDLVGGQNITDLAGNALPNGEPSTDETYLVDNDIPGATSFTRQTPATSPTNADTLVFRITFDEAMIGVDAGDFNVAGSTTATITSLVTADAGAGQLFDATVSGGDLATFNGSVGLNLASGQNIADPAGNALPNAEPATDEIYVVDNGGPILTSFTRQSPVSSPTNADSLVFRATFQEAMTAIDAADFAVNGTTTAAITSVTSADSNAGLLWDVTVSGGDLATFNGTVGLNLAGSQNITDLAGVALANGEPATDETYVVDNDAPAFNSIARQTPATSPTNADILVFALTFSENVANVSADDFTILGTTAAGVLTGSGSSYTLTVSGGNLTSLNGTVGIDLAASQNITDLGGTALPAGEPATDETYLVDNTIPAFTSITRQNPATSPTNADVLVFRATFTESVENVDSADFSVSGTTGTVTAVATVNPSTYDVTVSGGDLATLNGTVGLNLVGGHNIADPAGNALPATEPATDETYLVDNTAVTFRSIARQNPTTTPTNADQLVFRASFSEAVANLDGGDFMVSGTTATITNVATVDAETYDLTVSGGDLASLTATVGLDLASSQNITDVAGTALATVEPATDQTYAVDNTAPTTVSFTRSTPTDEDTNANTLTFRATFSKDVVGVDVADFNVTGTTGMFSVAQLTPSTYDVTVFGGDLPTMNGVVGLNLAAGQNVVDRAGNPLPMGEPATDETYTIDNTAPGFTSITRMTPPNSPTNADTLVFALMFSENVVNVSADDFIISGTTASGVLAGTGANYTLTVSGGNLASLDGTVGLNVSGAQNITDMGGNVLPATEPPVDEAYVVDNTAPRFLSLARQDPATSPTASDVLTLRATFSETVTNVDAADFVVNGTTGTITNVSAVSGSTYDLTLSGGDLANLNGTVGLDLAGGQNITDLGGTALPGGEAPTDESYVVDNTAPIFNSIARHDPPTSPTNADTLIFRATFNEAVANVDTADFAVNGTTATVTNVSSINSTTYDVTVSGGNLAGLNGTVGLDLAAGQNITDLAANALPTSEPATDETYVVDNDSPGATSFTRQTPATSRTSADTLVFRVTFDEAMVDVDTADFAVNGTTTATVTNVASADSSAGLLWDVTVSGGDLGGFNGTVGIDLASGQDITDQAGNALPGTEPTTDETYVVDNDAPGTASFTRQTPSTSPTAADVLVFRVTFDEAMTNVDAADFAAAGTTATITNVSNVSTSVYDVTVSGGDLAGLNGTVGLNLAGSQNVTDLAGNALPSSEPATDETYVVDNDNPAATGFRRHTPATSPTNADVLVFRAVFDEAMTNVDATDFSVNGSTTATITNVASGDSGAGLLWDLTVSGGDLASFNGTVGLDLASSQNITDLSGNPLPNGEPATDETYVVDNDAPATTSFTRQTPATSPTNADTLVFRVTFDEAMANVDATDFTVNGNTTANVTGVATADAGAGLLWDATVAGGDLAGFNGTVGLDFASTHNITDRAGNALPSTEPATDETYIVDNDSPGASSIRRGTPATSPTNADVLIFRVTFDEAMANVDAADFGVTGTTATVTNVSSTSATTYDVTVSGGDLAALNGTVGLDFASSHNMTDLAGNVLPTTEPTTDETYVVDNDAPQQTGFRRQTPMASHTDADSLVFRAVFDEAMTNVDTADFTVNSSSTATVTAVASGDGGAGLLWDVTVSGGDLPSFDGTVGLDFAAGQNITDLSGNALPGGEPATDEVFTVDNDSPGVSSFTRQDPATSPTNANVLIFRATFDEAMTNVDPTDFAASGTSGTVTAVAQVSPTTYDVTVSGGNLPILNGTVGLDLASGRNMTDLAGLPLPTVEPTIDETYVVDNDSPTASSFTRLSPTASPTNADTLTFRVSFDEAMSNVDVADFAVNGVSTATVSAVSSADSGAGFLWNATVSGGDLAGFNGTVGLDFSSAQNITDRGGNALPAGEPSVDETYVLDNVAASGSSFTRKTPTTESTNADVLVFLASFSEGVEGVDAGDFSVSGTNATVTNISQLTTSTYDITVSGGDLPGLNGIVGLNFNTSQNIRDLAGNALTGGEPSIDETYTLDNTAPGTSSFTRKTPPTSPTNSNVLTFLATFDQPISGIDPADFVATGTTANIAVAQITPSTYDITLSGGDLPGLNGTVGLNFSGTQNITDPVGNPLPSAEPAIDETYDLDNQPPTLIGLTRLTPTNPQTDADIVTFRATFDEPVLNVDANDFVADGTTGTVSVSPINPSVYDVTLSGGNLQDLNGTVGLNLSGSQDIVDRADNPLPNAEPGTDETFTLDNVEPAATSFTRFSPLGMTTNADTLVFRTFFNEPVTNVDRTDFSVTGTTATVAAVTSIATDTFDVTVTGGDLAELNATVGLDLASGQNITDLNGTPLPTVEPQTDEVYQVQNSEMIVATRPEVVGDMQILENFGHTSEGVLVGFAYGFSLGRSIVPDVLVELGIVPEFSNVGLGINNTVIGLAPQLVNLPVDIVYFQSFEILPRPKTSQVLAVRTADGTIVPSDELGLIDRDMLDDPQGEGEAGSPLQNTALQGDVDGDGVVTPRDALVVVNKIVDGGSRAVTVYDGMDGESPIFVDVNGDFHISAIDVLQVVNAIQGQSLAEGEDAGLLIDAVDRSTNESAIIESTTSILQKDPLAVDPVVQSTPVAANEMSSWQPERERDHDLDEDLLDAIATDVTRAWGS